MVGHDAPNAVHSLKDGSLIEYATTKSGLIAQVRELAEQNREASKIIIQMAIRLERAAGDLVVLEREIAEAREQYVDDSDRLRMEANAWRRIAYSLHDGSFVDMRKKYDQTKSELEREKGRR